MAHNCSSEHRVASASPPQARIITSLLFTCLINSGEVEDRLTRQQVEPSGIVRVTVPPAFGRLYILPRLAEFFTSFPHVALDILVSERHENLVEEGIDVAIRMGNLNDSTLIARKLARCVLSRWHRPLIFTNTVRQKHLPNWQDTTQSSTFSKASRVHGTSWGLLDRLKSNLGPPSEPMMPNTCAGQFSPGLELVTILAGFMRKNWPQASW